jgi:hypothetical protein
MLPKAPGWEQDLEKDDSDRDDHLLHNHSSEKAAPSDNANTPQKGECHDF